jgi:hypothetical protein
LNLEIVENSNNCNKFQFLPNKLIFCCGNYSREETIQGQKLYEEIWYFKNTYERKYCTGSPPLTRFFGPEKNRVKGGVF